MFNRWSCKLSGVMFEERFPVNRRVCDVMAAGGDQPSGVPVSAERAVELWPGLTACHAWTRSGGLDHTVGVIRKGRAEGQASIGPRSHPFFFFFLNHVMLVTIHEQSFMHCLIPLAVALNATRAGVSLVTRL